MNTKEKVKIMQTYLDGKTIQTKRTYEWIDFENEPTWNWDHVRYRTKPEQNIINIDMIIGTHTDCEFINNNNTDWDVGKLTNIHSCGSYERNNMGVYFDKCRVRENHWHYHNGSSKRPIPEGLAVDVQYIRNRQVIQYLHAEPDWDRVTVYQVIHQKDCWVYPWEVKND